MRHFIKIMKNLIKSMKFLKTIIKTFTVEPVYKIMLEYHSPQRRKEEKDGESLSSAKFIIGLTIQGARRR